MDHIIAGVLFSVGALVLFVGCWGIYGAKGGLVAMGLSLMLAGIKLAMEHKLDLIWRRSWRG
jgi:hypothetical protein